MKELFHLYEFIARKASPKEWEKIRKTVGKQVSGIPKIFTGKLIRNDKKGTVYNWKIYVVSLDEIRVEVMLSCWEGRWTDRFGALLRWQFDRRLSEDVLLLWRFSNLNWSKRQEEPSAECFPKSKKEARACLDRCFAGWFIRPLIDEMEKALEYQMQRRFSSEEG